MALDDIPRWLNLSGGGGGYLMLDLFAERGDLFQSMNFRANLC